MGMIADQLMKRKRKRKRESREQVRPPDSQYASSATGTRSTTKAQSTAAFLAEARRRG
jgi:hypothetical protein